MIWDHRPGNKGFFFFNFKSESRDSSPRGKITFFFFWRFFGKCYLFIKLKRHIEIWSYLKKLSVLFVLKYDHSRTVTSNFLMFWISNQCHFMSFCCADWGASEANGTGGSRDCEEHAWSWRPQQQQQELKEGKKKKKGSPPPSSICYVVFVLLCLPGEVTFMAPHLPCRILEEMKIVCLSFPTSHLKSIGCNNENLFVLVSCYWCQ